MRSLSSPTHFAAQNVVDFGVYKVHHEFHVVCILISNTESTRQQQNKKKKKDLQEMY